MRRWLIVALVAVPGALGLAGIAAGARTPSTSLAPVTSGVTGGALGQANLSLVGQGRDLFVASCSYCHGFNAQGIAGRAPSLVGVGAQAADFYLSTGRMPLPNPHAYPEIAKPAFTRAQIDALDAYVGSLGGPGIPSVDPVQGDISKGEQAFALNCSGCHQIIARGGIVTGSAVPALQHATATEIAEAVRVGPYLMPRFSTGEIDAQTLNSIARYVIYTRHPADRGGWGIGHIGPIPEGLVAWLLALTSLLLIARLIGRRTT
ncbi:MAG: c-type cytochrome [Solirubrobacteraceae bacterium]